jgi:hypothetical protein
MQVCCEPVALSSFLSSPCYRVLHACRRGYSSWPRHYHISDVMRGHSLWCQPHPHSATASGKRHCRRIVRLSASATSATTVAAYVLPRIFPQAFTAAVTVLRETNLSLSYSGVYRQKILPSAMSLSDTHMQGLCRKHKLPPLATVGTDVSDPLMITLSNFKLGNGACILSLGGGTCQYNR